MPHSLRTSPLYSALQRPGGFFSAGAQILRDIKIAHTIFALPFALLATLMAAQDRWPELDEWALILLCMFGARTWAMTVNRLADADFDRRNPRTRSRALPAGLVNRRAMLWTALAAALLFVVGAGLLSQMALLCSVPVLLILASYSFAKRLTWLCHFWLGMCLGLAPIGAYLAISGKLSLGMGWLGLAICFWVGGFDIIYALQDLEFDREEDLSSIPARFGEQVAKQISAASHAVALALFAVAGWTLGTGAFFAGGIAIAAGLLLWQHVLIQKSGRRAIPFVFFHLNGWVAVVFFIATLLDRA